VDDGVVVEVFEAKGDAGDEKFWVYWGVLDWVSVKVFMLRWCRRSPPYIRSRTK
jgi:hypothetical protein